MIQTLARCLSLITSSSYSYQDIDVACTSVCLVYPSFSIVFSAGQPCVHVLGRQSNECAPSIFDKSGPTVSFICFNMSGDVIPHTWIQSVADEKSVHIRFGCFCNMGGCVEALGLTDAEIRNLYNEGNIAICHVMCTSTLSLLCIDTASDFQVMLVEIPMESLS